MKGRPPALVAEQLWMKGACWLLIAGPTFEQKFDAPKFLPVGWFAADGLGWLDNRLQCRQVL